MKQYIKRTVTVACVLLLYKQSISQTNVFPASGNVGIGTLSPQYGLDVNGSLRVGNFSVNDADEWPNFVWCRDLANSWDEGLIKHSSTRGVFNRCGFGIHMEQSREFGFWSTGWNQLFAIKGGTGDVYIRGNVGIGTSNPGIYKLAVEGTLGARKIKVTQASPWADYVFDSSYQLKPLTELEKFIKINKHLPDVPTAREVEKEGIDVGENQALLLKKVEELTLYMIEIKKENCLLKQRIEKLESEE